MQLDPSIWPTSIFGLRFIEPIRGGDSLAALFVGAALLVIGAVVLVGWESIRRWQPRTAVTLAVVIGLFVVIGGLGVHGFYLRNRYDSTGPPLAPWARGVRHQRIAIVGPFAVLQYQLYGKDLSNYVQYIGKSRSDGSFNSVRDCITWRRNLNSGRYSYVFILDDTKPLPIEAAWTRSDPAATLVPSPDGRFPKSSVYLFRINGHLDSAGCSRLPKDLQTTPEYPELSGAT
jgi:hypothetical protein